MRQSYAIRVYKESFNFASCHFLIFGDGSREALHGHNYRVQVRVDGDLGAGDVVIDFIELKPLIKAMCDELDHLTLLPEHNPHLELAVGTERVEARHSDGSYFCFPRRDVRVLPIPNTSTEMLARYLAQRIVDVLPKLIGLEDVRGLEVQVEESAGQCGLCRLDLAG